MPTNEERKGKLPLYTSDDDSADEQHRHPPSPTVNSDQDLNEVVEGLDTLTVTKKATPTKTSSETYLRNYWENRKAGWSAEDARGAVDTNQYNILMKLRKLKECPYGTDQPDLREAWFDFVKNFPPKPTSDAYYLKAFGKAYTKNPDLEKARGKSGLYKFCALKKIVDEDLKFSGELEEYELLLKRVWTHEPKPCTERSTLTHLVDFHESYQKDGDFKKARGKWNSPKYQALSKLTNVQDLSTYDEPYRSMILKLQEVWVTPKVTTWKGHLEDFHESYQKDGDFKKARGKWDSARYNALNILKNVQDLSKYDEPHRRMIRKLQEVWQGLTTWEEHLEDFDESYQKHGDFKKARGKNSGPRCQALRTLNNVQDLSEYDEPHRSMIRKLQEVWNEPFEAPVGDEPEDFEDFLTNYVQQISFVNGAPVGDEPEDFEAPVGEAQKTPEEHLEDFDESYRKDRRDAWEQHLIDFYECYEQETSFVNTENEC